MDYLLVLLVISGNVLGAGMIVPQVLRLRQRSTTEGVSAVGVGVGIAQNVWWVTYGLQAEAAFGIVPVSVAGVVLYGTIAVQLIGIDGRSSVAPILGGLTGIGLVPFIPYLLANLHTTGVVIGLLYTVQFAPAAIAAVRTSDPVGLSAATWSMAWSEAVIWFAYGLIVGDPALAVGGAGGSLLAGIILVRVVTTRQPERRRLAVSPRSF